MSMQRTRAFTSNSSRQTAVVHSHQNSSLPRIFSRRVSQPSLSRGRSLTVQKAANMQHQIQKPATSEPQPFYDASMDGLRSLTFDQRQALLFLAISSAALTTSDLTQASDLQFLAAVDRGQVISFLVNNPFVTLGVAVALYIIVPRILRLTVKYIFLPASVAGVVYLVITNPNTSLGVVKTAFNCEYEEQLCCAILPTHPCSRIIHVAAVSKFFLSCDLEQCNPSELLPCFVCMELASAVT